MKNSSKRITIKERLEMEFDREEGYPWKLSADSFGDVGADINDFMMENYVYFLDNVKSLDDLRRGLIELRPLFDDALEVAEQMSIRDFSKFKRALRREHELSKGKEGKSIMPAKYGVILFPKLLVLSSELAEKALVPLGAALIRMAEFEEENNRKEK